MRMELPVSSCRWSHQIDSYSDAPRSMDPLCVQVWFAIAVVTECAVLEHEDPDVSIADRAPCVVPVSIQWSEPVAQESTPCVCCTSSGHVMRQRGSALGSHVNSEHLELVCQPYVVEYRENRCVSAGAKICMSVQGDDSMY